MVVAAYTTANPFLKGLQNWLFIFIQTCWLLKAPVLLWFVPLKRKCCDDIKLIAIARSIGIKNTNVFGKLFSFYGVSNDAANIKLVEIVFAMTNVESMFNNFVV